MLYLQPRLRQQIVFAAPQDRIFRFCNLGHLDMVRVDLVAVVLLTLVICRVVLASCMSDKHELPCDGMMTLEPTFPGEVHCTSMTITILILPWVPDLTQATSYGPLGWSYTPICSTPS